MERTQANCFRLFVLPMAVVIMALTTHAGASPLIYASATMGTPNQGEGGGILLGQVQYNGARFQLTETYTVDAIGGHLRSTNSNPGPELFGALVELTGPGDFPDSSNMLSADVVASATFDATPLSSDMIVPVTPIDVGPGWYAIVFGGGALGAANANNGEAKRTGQTPAPGVSLITWNGGWSPLSDFWPRYTVYGTLVPEPSSLALLGLSAFILVRRR